MELTLEELKNKKWIKSNLWGDTVYYLDQFGPYENVYNNSVIIVVSRTVKNLRSINKYEIELHFGVCGETTYKEIKTGVRINKVKECVNKTIIDLLNKGYTFNC